VGRCDHNKIYSLNNINASGGTKCGTQRNCDYHRACLPEEKSEKALSDWSASGDPWHQPLPPMPRRKSIPPAAPTHNPRSSSGDSWDQPPPPMPRRKLNPPAAPTNKSRSASGEPSDQPLPPVPRRNRTPPAAPTGDSRNWPKRILNRSQNETGRSKRMGSACLPNPTGDSRDEVARFRIHPPEQKIGGPPSIRPAHIRNEPRAQDRPAVVEPQSGAFPPLVIYTAPNSRVQTLHPSRPLLRGRRSGGGASQIIAINPWSQPQGVRALIQKHTAVPEPQPYFDEIVDWTPKYQDPRHGYSKGNLPKE
jgi:hypothetical protein